MIAEQQAFYERIACRLYERSGAEDVRTSDTVTHILSVAGGFKKSKALMLRRIKQLDSEAAEVIASLTIREMEVFSRLRNIGDIAELLMHEGRLYDLGVLLLARLNAPQVNQEQARKAAKLLHDVEAERTNGLLFEDAGQAAETPGRVVSMSPIKSLAPPRLRVFEHRTRVQSMRLAG